MMHWIKDALGIDVFVVQHTDQEPITMHHSGVIYARDQAQDLVTVLLDSIDVSVPHDPNERKLP
jgi:hypothetical protein